MKTTRPASRREIEAPATPWKSARASRIEEAAARTAAPAPWKSARCSRIEAAKRSR